MKRLRILVAASIATAALNLCPVAHGGQYVPVALSNALAPDDPDGARFDSFISMRLNDAGQVVFTARLGASNERGIWLGDESSSATVARTGQPAPQTPDGVFFLSTNSFTQLGIGNSGMVAFFGALDGPGIDTSGQTNNTGLWMGTPGDLQLVTRKGSQAPSLPVGVLNAGFHSGTFNLAGNDRLAFTMTLSGSGVTPENNVAMYAGGAGGIVPIARTGEQAPGMAGGVTFVLFRNANEDVTPQVRRDGSIAFLGRVEGPGISSLNDHGIWAGHGGALSIVARETAPAPHASGVTFVSFKTPVLDETNQLAFVAELAGSGVTNFNDGGIWAGTPGRKISRVAREGDPAPGTTATFFGGLGGSGFHSYDIADNGDIAFSGRLTGAGVNSSNDAGIWRASPQRSADPAISDYLPPARLIAREGDPAPGTNGVFDTLVDFELNARGDMIFFAHSTDTQALEGIWTAIGDDVELFLAEGMEFEVAPGDTRIVSFLTPIISFPPTPSGFFTRLNDDGQIAFGASFTDGTSGIFLAAVPEPSSTVSVLCLTSALLGRSKRRGYRGSISR